MRIGKWLNADHLPATAALLAALAAVAVARGQAAPDFGPGDGGRGGGPGGPGGGPSPHRMHHHPTTAPDEVASPVSGTVTGYNRDPHGRINGLVLGSGSQTIQLNAPPDWGDALQTAAPLKESISATAVPERVVGDRTVDRLVTLSGHGKTLTAGGPGERHPMHLDGTVASLNFSPRGELDGALLDSGDFVHVNPGSAAKLGLAVGQKLSVDGQAEPTSDGHQAVEAETVNGTTLPRPPRPMRGEDGGPGMRPMHGHPGGPDGDDDEDPGFAHHGPAQPDHAPPPPGGDDMMPPS